MIIKIDNRESELLKKIEHEKTVNDSFKDIEIIVENLPLGDIIIFDKVNNMDLVIIERKTLNDLSASIKDGRYEEQSYRLNGIEHHNHNIVYLIEGNIQNTSPLIKYKWDKPTMYSAMVSIALYKGFSLLRSQDITETAYMICNMVYKIGKSTNRSFYYSNANITSSEATIHTQEETDNPEKTRANAPNYCNVVKRVKKDNITKDNIGQIMLCQIPGVSSQTACVIINKFNNISNLIKSIETDDTCMNDIYTTDSKNKPRKISKTSIANILAYLRP